MSKEITITKKYYESNYSHWINDKTNSFFYEKQFAKLFTLWKPKAKILYIGCAGGVLVPLFLGIGRHTKYQGLDICQKFIKISQSRYPQLKFNLGDIADSRTLPKTKFDGFAAVGVLMHIPFAQWDETFANIENIMKSDTIGFITLPTEHPRQNPDEDPRHFTILEKSEQQNYFKKRGWKIKASGTSNGFTKNNIWQWYIVELPKK